MRVSIFRKGVWQCYKLPHFLPVLPYSSSTRKGIYASERKSGEDMRQRGYDVNEGIRRRTFGRASCRISSSPLLGN